MNRVEHLAVTLPRNIADNEDYTNLEFIILDYNSSDQVSEWLLRDFGSLMSAGRLSLYRETSASFFHPAHARNVCARLASGDVLCNLDADNFTGPGFASYLATLFDAKRRLVAHSPTMFTRSVRGSSHGRIALSRRDFYSVGGYDETTLTQGYGVEDDDLLERCIQLGFRTKALPARFLTFIDHDNLTRLKCLDFDGEIVNAETVPILHERSIRIRRELSHANIFAFHRYIANAGKPWGCAELYRNAGERVIIEAPWPTLF